MVIESHSVRPQLFALSVLQNLVGVVHFAQLLAALYRRRSARNTRTKGVVGGGVLDMLVGWAGGKSTSHQPGARQRLTITVRE